MKTTTLQVPLSVSLRNSAKKAAQAQGFSSLQEFVRLVLTKLANQTVSITINEEAPPEFLTHKQEARLDKLVKEAEADYKAGKLKTFTNTKDMLEYFDSL